MGIADQSRSHALVWDLPARLCHWGFGLSLVAALWIAFQHDPESEIFKYHMPLGCLAAWFLGIRVVLGFVGSPLSRWRRWLQPPRVVAAYLGAVVRGKPAEPAGVNPGTLLYAPLVWLAVPILMLTGYVADWAETWHGRVAWGLTGLIACHLLGLVLHALRHRRPTPLAMVHGRRFAVDPADRAAHPHLATGLVWLAISMGLAVSVLWRFDPLTCVWRVLPSIEIAFPLIQRG